MAASGAPARQPRRGPAPIASFDHDGSDESSPESKLAAARLPEIREDAARAGATESLAPAEQRARSHSTPAAGALAAPPAPRIDISRASSSSHHDSRDSSPELALFTGGGGDRAALELGFREDGALDLRSSTEELAFLEPAPGEPAPAPAPAPRPASAVPPPPPSLGPAERRHSRKDSQSSEAALLAVSGRTSRLSSVGSQCSALSRVSRLSVVSGASRSPSPHRMLLETSFCGPKPIETDPEISAGALVEQILGIVNDATLPPLTAPVSSPPAPAAAPVTRDLPPAEPVACELPPATLVAPDMPPAALVAPFMPPATLETHDMPPAAPVDARDRREVRTEVTVESARTVPITPAVTVVAPPSPVHPAELATAPALDIEKNEKEAKNRTQTEERKARPRIRREPSEPEVYKTRNKSKNIIRIKLKPDDSYEEEEEEVRGTAAAGGEEAARKPATLELGVAARPAAPAPVSPTPSRRRSPSPAGAPVSRKSSFCSLFKSRETIASPESPSEALRRKRSLTEGRSRSKSRDRSATPTSGNKIRGSVLSLFRTPRRSAAGASPSPGSREGSPVVQGARPLPGAPPPPDRRRAAVDRLKYYEDTKDGIIHIPLRTPPDERGAAPRRSSGTEPAPTPAAPRDPRPASAPQPRAAVPDPEPPLRPPSAERVPSKPIHRTVLPDGSIIIPLHSPTDRASETEFPEKARVRKTTPVAMPETKAIAHRSETPPTVTSPATAAKGEVLGAGAVEACPAPAEAGAPAVEEARHRRKERLVFTTHVGSREQVFSTQFSITKTPSVTSEISGSFPSFAESEPPAPPPPLRDTHIAEPGPGPGPAGAESGAATPQDALRDSSESEPSSETAPSRAGNDVEKRVLVVAQESFEEDLPYVPTTLPQERSVALPMVPVRERGGVRVSGVQRPRGSAQPARAAPRPPAPPPPHADKLRIKLPRRPRPASASASATASAPAPRAEPPRGRSAADTGGGESRSKTEWIDFEEVPERRKQPKRIQTLPAGTSAPLVFSYVEPEHCRCECHAHAHAHAHARPDDDQLPLLTDDVRASIISTSSAECGDSEQLSPEPAGSVPATAGGVPAPAGGEPARGSLAS